MALLKVCVWQEVGRQKDAEGLVTAELGPETSGPASQPLSPTELPPLGEMPSLVPP